MMKTVFLGDPSKDDKALAESAVKFTKLLRDGRDLHEQIHLISMLTANLIYSCPEEIRFLVQTLLQKKMFSFLMEIMRHETEKEENESVQ